ncbi:MAG: arginine--tRNA ligase [Thermoplasmata archaeon]
MAPPKSELSPDPWSALLDGIVDGLVRVCRAAGSVTSPEALRALLDLDGGAEGDIALPTHRLAKALGQSPDSFASSLVARWTPIPGVASVSSAGAFVNVRVDPALLATETLSRVFARAGRYGHGDPIATTTCVEHTSANPTGPLHIGRVRNGIVGDTLARVLRASGAPVTTQYYVDDLGRQAAMITWIWSKPASEWPVEIAVGAAASPPEGESEDARLGRPYPFVSAYLKEHPEAQAEVATLVQQIESGNPPPLHRELIEKILAGMLAALRRIGIEFDEFVWESSFLADRSVDGVIERLDRAPHTTRQPNGAGAIDVSAYGLPKDSSTVVYTRANGTSLYVTRDIAYHLSKFARFERVIDVLGQDHRLHSKTLDALLAEIGEPRRPTFVIYQDLTVPGGGRMSTRGGTAVWLHELIEEAVQRARAEVIARRPDLGNSDLERIAEAVATGAVRYHIVRVAPEKPVIFHWEDALSFEGRSGPFIQYAFARATSILERSEERNPGSTYSVERLLGVEEQALLRILARFPRVVADVARTGHVHSIAGYAHEVADQFNRFYHAVPVLTSGEDRSSRLALVAATRQTLGNALELLGIARLDSM